MPWIALYMDTLARTVSRQASQQNPYIAITHTKIYTVVIFTLSLCRVRVYAKLRGSWHDAEVQQNSCTYIYIHTYTYTYIYIWMKIMKYTYTYIYIHINMDENHEIIYVIYTYNVIHTTMVTT